MDLDRLGIVPALILGMVSGLDMTSLDGQRQTGMTIQDHSFPLYQLSNFIDPGWKSAQIDSTGCRNSTDENLGR